jgi:hypothetical protein
MFKFFTNYTKTKRLQSQIAKYQAKSELLKYKNALQSNKIRHKTIALGGVQKHLEAADDLKRYVTETSPDNSPASQIVKVLENETIQQLLRAAAFKFMGQGEIKAGDDELITIYKKLPEDVKANVKDLAMQYMTQKKKVKV